MVRKQYLLARLFRRRRLENFNTGSYTYKRHSVARSQEEAVSEKIIRTIRRTMKPIARLLTLFTLPVTFCILPASAQVVVNCDTSCGGAEPTTGAGSIPFRT